MKAHEFRNLSVEELTERLRVLKSELYAVTESIRLGKEKNHAKLRGIRADIARVQTILAQNSKVTA